MGFFLVGRKGWQNFSKQADCGLATNMLFALLPIVVIPVRTELGGDGSSDLNMGKITDLSR